MTLPTWLSKEVFISKSEKFRLPIANIGGIVEVFSAINFFSLDTEESEK